MNTLLNSISNATQSSATLEEILTRCANATTANDIQSLSTYLKASAKDTVLASLAQGGQEPLTLLDPGINTLGYIYILSARLMINNAPPVPTAQLLGFASRLDPVQAQMVPERMVLIAKAIWKRAEAANQQASAILPLREILKRYPADRSLTPIHPIFLNACVVAATPTQALPLLSHPITTVHTPSLPPPSSKDQKEKGKDQHHDNNLNYLTYLDALVYHYLGGILLGMLKKWPMAEEYFETCATAPTQSQSSASALQLEALKKLLLVQMIAYGKTPPLPKYLPPPLSRALKNTPYNSILKTYPAPYNLTEKDVKAFTADGNMGLVHQALEKSVRWRMKELTNTYVALGLGEMCDMVGVGREEGRTILLAMIEQNDIQASISLTPGTQTETVTFHSTGADIPSNEEMLALVESAQTQAKHLAQLERELGKNKEFLAKALKGGREDVYADEHMDVYSTRGGDWEEMNF